MLARVVRSGLSESTHDGAVAIVDSRGSVIDSSGDVDRPFYLRSTAKPFQAAACLDLGVELAPEQWAVASSSHSGYPVHVGLARGILTQYGLGTDDLNCTPRWPTALPERDRLARLGHSNPRPIWSDCSGKHATMLAACRVNGWDLQTYLELEHPLQLAIAGVVGEVMGEDPLPAGVDGCGAPVFRGTVVGLARGFAALSVEERFSPIATAMRRFPLLVSGPGRVDGLLAVWSGAVAKGGAEGVMGLGHRGRGIGVKAWDGAKRAADVGAIAAARRLGILSPASDRARLNRPVLGGGAVVGEIEPAIEWR